MVNLVAGRPIVPELIQDDFTPDAVAREAVSLLTDAARADAMRRDLADVRAKLGGPGASDGLRRGSDPFSTDPARPGPGLRRANDLRDLAPVRRSVENRSDPLHLSYVSNRHDGRGADCGDGRRDARDRRRAGEFREAVTEAALIVRGHVTDRARGRAADAASRRSVTVAVDRVLKGAADGLRHRARARRRRSAGTAFVIVGAPTFTQNEQVVFLLKRGSDNALRPIGLSHGRLSR